MPYQALADLVLVLHFSIVLFVIGGLVFILVGNLRHWHWVNNAWFRVLHVLAIAMVIAQSWLGELCPLTTLEMWLREQAHEETYTGGFFQHWVGELLFYDAPSWIFVLAYSLFGVLVLLAWWKFPPAFKRKK